MLRPSWMVDLGGLGKAFILGEKVEFKCLRHTKSVKRGLWKCYMKLVSSFFGMALYGACTRQFNTFADRGLRDSTKTFVHHPYHIHVILLIDVVHSPDPRTKAVAQIYD